MGALVAATIVFEINVDVIYVHKSVVRRLDAELSNACGVYPKRQIKRNKCSSNPAKWLS